MITNKLREIDFDKPVICHYEDEKVVFRNANSWDKLWRHIIPGLATCQDRKVMQAVMNILGQSLPQQHTEEVIKERQQWISCGKSLLKKAASSWLLGGTAADLSQSILIAQLEMYGLRQDVAKQNPDFLKFVRVNHLHHNLRSHGDRLHCANDEPMIKFEGEYIAWSNLKQRLGLDPKKNLNLKKIGYTYLGGSDYLGQNGTPSSGGIVRYDSKTWRRTYQDGTEVIRPMPWGKLSQEEKAELAQQGINLPYMENTADCRARNFPDQALYNKDHAFVKLVDKEGNIYYFGFMPKPAKNNWAAERAADLLCPDKYADTPAAYDRPVKRIELTEENYRKIFDQINKWHEFG